MLFRSDYTGVDGIAPVQTGFNWLDLNVQLSDLTNLSIGYTYAYGRNTINCQRVVVGPNQITNFSNLCRGFSYLQSVDIDTSTGTNLSYMFAGCPRLKIAPSLNTSSATNMSYMFSGSNIEIIPAYDYSNAINVEHMFEGTKITHVPPLTLPVATNISYMFSGSWIESLAYLDAPLEIGRAHV